MPGKAKVIPPPCLALTTWLSASTRSAGPDGESELRGSTFRRLEAVLVSALVTLCIVALGAWTHPIAMFRVWLVLELALFTLRVPLVLYIMRFLKQTGRKGQLCPWAVDAFILAGTAWSGLLGFGCFLSLLYKDPGFSILISLLAMGTIGGQCARNLSSPRLNSVQMGLIMLPFTAGAWFSNIPLTGWVIVLAPLFLAGMMSITFQLHADYVALINARLENRRQALHCSLTGLPNRAFFDDLLLTSFETLEPRIIPLTVLCLDLDGFKEVNDVYGHPAGDLLLQQVAQRLRDILGSDLAARLGGDEFAVLLTTCDVHLVVDIATRIIADLAKPFRLSNQYSVQVGVSIGIAFASVKRSSMDGPARLMAQADSALYEAKRAGRGTFRCYADGQSSNTFFSESTERDRRRIQAAA